MNAFDKLISAYEKIAETLPRLERLNSALKSNANFQVLLALVYADILEFHRRAYKMIRQRCKIPIIFNCYTAPILIHEPLSVGILLRHSMG